MSNRWILAGLAMLLVVLAVVPLFRAASIGELRPAHPYSSSERHALGPDARYRRGFGITSEEAGDLERRLAAEPGDVGARLELVGFLHRAGRRAAAVEHALWLIEHAPESAEPLACSLDHRDDAGADKAREPWLRHLAQRPDEPVILRNASAYFTRRDPARCLGLLQHGEQLEPADPWWPERIGRLHMGDSQTGAGEFDRDASLAALAAFERALDKLAAREATPADRVVELDLRRNAAIAAFRAGEAERAEAHAGAALAAATRLSDGDPRASSIGQAVHSANLVLGHVALRRGDLAEAERRLLAAGRTEGSPALSSFGPSMLLASELLECGSDRAVIEYLDLCQAFWKNPRLETWRSDVEAGRTPDFGPNLRYW